MGALRRPGRTSVRIAGDDLQWLHAWEAGLAALIDRACGTANPVVRVGVEVADVENLDDVVRFRQRPPHSYSQVKYAADATTPVNGDFLLAPSDAGGPSILEKIVKGWRKLTAGGAPVELSLITNRQIDYADPLVSGRDGQSLLLLPRAGDGGPRSKRGKARRRWAEATALSEEGLLELLEQLRFDCGFSVARMRQLLAAQMASVGLPSEGRDVNLAAAWIQERIRMGETEFDLDVIDRGVVEMWPTAELRRGPGIVTVPLAGTSEAGVRERLALLPPALRDQTVTVWRNYPADTWRLVTELTAQQPTPTEVAAEWASSRSNWLETVVPQVQLLAGELVCAYGQPRYMADLLAAAAAGGVQRGEFWRAHAMVIYEELGAAPERDLLRRDLESRPLNEPYTRAALLFLAGNREGALSELERWDARPDDLAVRALFRVRLMMAAEEPFAPGNLDRALETTASGLEGPVWSPPVAITRARLLGIRARRGGAGTWDRDLSEAAGLLLRARDERRVFRGNSADPVAELCAVLLAQKDPRQVVRVATFGDTGATRAEADHPVVTEHLAVAAVQLGELGLARDCLLRLNDEAARARVGAVIAEATDEDSAALWRAAVQAAPDDEQLGQALFGLAQTGATELPRLEELAVRAPQEAEEIRAQAAAASGSSEVAIRTLRTKTSTSLSAALTLSQIYGDQGRIDDQVAVLTTAARTFGDSSLTLTAADTLLHAGRGQEAQSLLNDFLAGNLAGGSSRAHALRMAARIADEDGRAHNAASILQNVLELEPSDISSRWALLDILLSRGELDAAWRELRATSEPLEPATILQARLWISLNVRRGDAPATVAGCLALLRRFSDDQEFGAFVIINLIMPGTIDDSVPPPLQEEARREIGQYFDRWPSGPIRQIVFTNAAEALAQMGALMGEGAERRRTLRSIWRGVLTAKLPVSFVASAAGRSYAEILLTRTAFAIPARHPDPAEHAACLQAVHAAANAPIVIDATAAAVLTALPVELRDALVSVFSRVTTTDTVTLDALAARDSLAMRSTGHIAPDDEHGAIPVEHATPAEADRLAEQAETLLALIQRFERVPRPATSAFPFDNTRPLITWASAADLAQQSGWALWSDDPILRMLARGIGIPATSTPAILDHLLATGVISDAEHESAIRTLIAAAVGDFPLDETRLVELAEDDRWQPLTVARVLVRPAIWVKPSAMMPVFERLVAEIRVHQPESLPTWLYAAVHGAAAVMSHRHAATTIAGNLLAIALTAGGATPTAAVALTDAARQALADAADPDMPPPASPLAACTKALMTVYTTRLPPDRAAQVVVVLFREHAAPDRRIVTEALLD